MQPPNCSDGGSRISIPAQLLEAVTFLDLSAPPSLIVSGGGGGVAILPIQCKGVVEPDVWVSHGVKGGELLQRLHQLHNGLVILKQKHHWMSFLLPGHRFVHLRPPMQAPIKAWGRSEASQRLSAVL